MKKFIALAFLTAFLFTGAYSQKHPKGKTKQSKEATKQPKEKTKHAKEEPKLSKEETKRLKEELKGYEKNLVGYKAKMDDAKATQEANDAEIKRLKDDMIVASTKQAELENKVAETDTKLKKAEQEVAMLKGENVENPDPEVAKKVKLNMQSPPPKGTVYKVQIGLYRTLNINRYFEQPRYVGYEEVDGMNRYIISYFPDEDIAQKFVEDVRKMGIKDAFVSKYIDGQRVYEWSKNPKYTGKKAPDNIQEAIQMNEPQQKGKKK